MGVDLDAWRQEALASKNDALETKVPLHVLFGEAVDVARFFTKYWKTQKEDGAVVRRGLDTATKKDKKLTKKTGDDILSLQRAAQEASSLYLLAVDSNSEPNPSERGHFVLGEIASALEWLFDDGVDDEKDKMLRAVDEAHEDYPETMDALASALDDYAHLAEPYRNELDGLGGFDAALIDEARIIAGKLRNRPSSPSPTTKQAREALGLRNKVVNLLNARMTLVRSAARFVFRDQPAIVREVTSAYERRKRAAARRAAAKENASEKKTPL